jgi:hypothetical protein
MSIFLFVIHMEFPYFLGVCRTNFTFRVISSKILVRSRINQRFLLFRYHLLSDRYSLAAQPLGYIFNSFRYENLLFFYTAKYYLI